jgi:response regulator NasT
MRVCIFSPEKELCESLAFDSQGAGYGVEQKFNQPQKLVEFISRSNSDHIVLIDARRQREDRLKLIKELCSDGPVAMVALANEADISLGSRAVEAGAQAVLVDPVKAKDIRFAFTIAVHQQAKQARLQSEIKRLQEKLVERKLIEKAKGILMDAAKVTEAEAFRLIQRESQDKRKSMAEIATSIISATQLVEEAARARLE